MYAYGKSFSTQHALSIKTWKEVLGRKRYGQWRSHNLKAVPQNFTEVFNIDNVTLDDAIQRNQHRKELSFFHFYGKNIVIVRSPVHGYACMLASLYYFDKNFTAHFQPAFTISKYK